MADDSSSSSAAPAGLRGVIVVFAFVAVLLAAAIAVVGITQVGSATTSQNAGTDVRLMRLDMDRARQDALARDRQLADLSGRTAADATRFAEDLKTLRQTDAGLREEIARAAEQQQRQADLLRETQRELGERLTQLANRMEALRTEVVLKETEALHRQIADAKTGIDQTQKDVGALRQALRDTDVPGLRAKVQGMDLEVARIGTDLTALTRASEAFRAQITQASEAFRNQVTEFFQTILYNDPWGRSTPETPTPPSP